MNEDDGLIMRDGASGEEGLEPLVIIDIDEVNDRASTTAQLITERLSNYYFDDKYIKEHPYIPTKIMTEMDNVRRLLKMLIVNEQAQDALIKSIAFNASKGTLYLSLTSLQKSILLIQRQLNDLVSSLEEIFQKMQAEAEKAWAERDKEEGDDGTLTVRGSREFIRELNERMNARKKTTQPQPPVEEKKDDDGLPEGATPISDIIG